MNDVQMPVDKDVCYAVLDCPNVYEGKLLTWADDLEAARDFIYERGSFGSIFRVVRCSQMMERWRLVEQFTSAYVRGIGAGK